MTPPRHDDRTAAPAEPSSDRARLTHLLGRGLLAYAVLRIACTGALSLTVGFPGIVDAPPEEALRAIHDHTTATALFYPFAASGVLLAALALTAYRLLTRDGPAGLGALLTTAAGVTAGLAQAIGALRWPVVAPTLADQYLSAADPMAREAARTGWLVVNALAGHLTEDLIGFVLAALALAGFARALTPRLGQAWTTVGAALAVFGALEFSTFVLPEPVAAVVDIPFSATYALALVWLAATGVRLIRASRRTSNIGTLR
jgi:ABC-type tungstate transport system substrate-binding protein